MTYPLTPRAYNDARALLHCASGKRGASDCSCAIGALTTLSYGLIMGYLFGPQQEKALRLLVRYRRSNYP